jgi:pilus assembly protein CpaC
MMNTLKAYTKWSWLVLLFLCGMLLPFHTAFSQDAGSKKPQQIRLTLSHSQLMNIPFSVNRVSVGDPEIADVVVLTPRQIYILGKGLGGTNLLLQGTEERLMILELLVEADLTLLKEKLHALLPEEDIHVHAAKDGIILKGEVSSASVLSTALSISEPFAPKKIVNLMQVGGLQQVLLEVKVAEVSRSTLNELGVNYQSIVNDTFIFTNLGSALPTALSLTVPDLNLSSFESEVSPSTNLILGTPQIHLLSFIKALKENGLIKILAEPNLMTVSGQEATFLAGGEFPIPVPQSGSTAGSISIDYKKFGVQLKFTPTVLNSDKISLKVAPEVSEVDFTTAVQVGGFVVPGVTTRGATTTVELMDGHTFAIAGLIREDAKNIVTKFPILGDIPILGMLFRSTSFRKDETELVILVTPRLVKSLGAADTASLPTDRYHDFERELMGYSFKVPKEEAPLAPPRGGLEGEFGHSE